MESGKDIKAGSAKSILSRRNLFKGAAALTAAASVNQALAQPTGAPFGTVWLYIGTYTGNVGGGGNGQGIYLCELDLFTGRMTVVRLVAPALPAAGTMPSTSSPSTITIDPTGLHLYAGNEIGPPGAVSAYSINRLTGDLTYLNGQPAMGSPAYVGTDNTGRYLLSAEYTGGWFEAFPILANGTLGPAVFQQQDVGNVGPKTATSGPPGNFNISAHEGPNGHPHNMQTDPSNQWVIGTDAGQDRIYVWKLTANGTPSPLVPAAVPFVNVPPGDGPRHFAFHPNGIWMYSIQEEGDTIMFWHFNPATGALSQQQIIPSVPPGYTGTCFTSEIRVSPDGRFVYGANRLSDTIGVFRVGFNGQLTQISNSSTKGDYPRVISIDPSGKYMVSLNQRADNATTFVINSGILQVPGSLTFTGNYTPVGSPSGMAFLI